MNKFMALGRLTRDVEVKQTHGGTTVADFALALNERFTNKDGEKIEKVVFADFVVFGKQAEVLGQWLSKGDQLLVTNAQLQIDSWTDKTSGEQRKAARFKVLDFEFVGSGKNTDNGSSSTKTGKGRKPKNEPDESEDSDIPF